MILIEACLKLAFLSNSCKFYQRSLIYWVLKDTCESTNKQKRFNNGTNVQNVLSLQVVVSPILKINKLHFI